MCPTQIQLWFQ